MRCRLFPLLLLLCWMPLTPARAEEAHGMRLARVHGMETAHLILRQVAVLAREGRDSAAAFLASADALRGTWGREAPASA